MIASAVVVAIMLAAAGGSSGSSDAQQVATRVARSCPEMTERALSAGLALDEVAAAEQLAAEVWVGGEFVRDIRIVLWRELTGVKAEVAEAVGEGVCDQLREIYGSEPLLAPDEVVKRVSVRTRRVTEAEVPALRTIIERARELQLSTTLSSTIYAPSRSVRIRVTNGLEEVVVAFVEPEPSAEGVAFSGTLAVSQPEAAKWVDQLLSALGLP